MCSGGWHIVIVIIWVIFSVLCQCDSLAIMPFMWYSCVERSLAISSNLLGWSKCIVCVPRWRTLSAGAKAGYGCFYEETFGCINDFLLKEQDIGLVNPVKG